MRHQAAFITPVCSPANVPSQSCLGRPVSQTDTQALTISRQSTQSAACYQLSNWISGTNVITAGVFIYIIIITALPRGARGECQGLGRDEGGRKEKGGRTSENRRKSPPVQQDRLSRRQTTVRSRLMNDRRESVQRFVDKLWRSVTQVAQRATITLISFTDVNIIMLACRVFSK